MIRRSQNRPTRPRRVSPTGRLALAALLSGALGLIGLAQTSSALAQGSSAWWRLSSSSAPTDLQPGDTEDIIIAGASNVGDADADGGSAPITMTDKLPARLIPKAVRLISSIGQQAGTCEPLPALRCSFTGAVAPFGRLEVRITVEVASTPSGPLQNEIEIGGGEAASSVAQQAADRSRTTRPRSARRRSNSHQKMKADRSTRRPARIPFQLTTALDFNETLEHSNGNVSPSAPALLKDLHFDLPPGMIGDPQATPQCSNLDFSTQYSKARPTPVPRILPSGAALVTLNEPANAGYLTATVPLFNLTPAPGEPARFGFEAFNVPVVLDASVRTGGDYSVQVNVSNATTAAQVLGSEVIFWGEPGDPRHDNARGWQCIDGRRRRRPKANRAKRPIRVRRRHC